MCRSVLQKLDLESVRERFESEKITPDIVNKLPLNKFKELGVQNRFDIMASRVERTKYGSEEWGECGPPKFDIPKVVLECYLDENLTIEEISKMLSVSQSIIYRRMRYYGLSKLEFSEISDEARTRPPNGWYYKGISSLWWGDQF